MYTFNHWYFKNSLCIKQRASNIIEVLQMDFQIATKYLKIYILKVDDTIFKLLISMNCPEE